MKRSGLTGCILLGALLVLVPIQAEASAPAAVTLTLVFSGRTWSATGALSDSGGWRFADFDPTGSIAHSPQVGSVHDTFLLTSGDGSTIQINDQALFTLTGFSERWVIASGTGRYANLQGEGSGALAGALTLTGEVH